MSGKTIRTLILLTVLAFAAQAGGYLAYQHFSNQFGSGMAAFAGLSKIGDSS